MYKIIFADDEKLVRERISKIINWEAAGFTLVSCCANGHEVMEAMEAAPVDLAVLDINMPFITGLEAAQQIRNSYPHTKIVFLTGYTEFEYAQKAVALGVYKYIVKPISADDFRELLAEIKDILDKENGDMHKVATLEQRQQENQKVLLQDLTQETTPAIYDRVQAQGFAWTQDTAFQVAVLQVDDKQSDTPWQRSEESAMRYAVCNVLNELAEDAHLGYAFEKDGDVVFIGYGCGGSALQVAMQALLSRMLHIATQVLHFTITVGLGEVQRGCDNIHLSYKEGLRAANLRRSEGGNKIYTKEDLTESYVSYTAVWDAIAYIEQNYAVPTLSVDDVSAHLHISPSYLRTLFKRQTDSSVIAYITKTRMEHALELLKNPSMKNAMVAEAIGYTDARYFSYCFKRYYGMTVAEKRVTL